MVVRGIVRIDEGKCTGCGLCTISCAESALKLVDGKARLLSDNYCDGLGACLGECPEGAITIEEREAEAFDEEAVHEHLQGTHLVPPVHQAHPVQHACPSAQVRSLERNLTGTEPRRTRATSDSMLSQWPVQLALVPPTAPFFEAADLLIVADCVPFAYADFHGDFLKGRTLVIGCPKLDDAEFYKERLTETFKRNNIQSLTVINMEVPCCFGLYRLVKAALDASGKSIPLRQETIGIGGAKIPSLH